MILHHTLLSVDMSNFSQAIASSSIAQAKKLIKHGSFVGVSDPTGCIPEGHVFLTGYGKQTPSELFVTRVCFTCLL